ncbi:MAG TPA: hypothetical protein VFV97_16450 [Rhodanobacteraceae bacterium]|nr:hypothetical protein [Rhodanobacteraceae bacterium]
MKTSFLASLVFGATLALAGGIGTDAWAAKAPKPKAEPAKPAGEPIEYAALETRVGETISVDTTFHTTRTGKLIKWTQPTLTVEVGNGSDTPMVLTVPKETIKSITIMPAAAAEPAKDAGTSGAKKN